MTFVVADRVQETTNSPGTGTATLLGAVSGYQSFSTGVGINNTTYYVIADQLGTNWEVGLGALDSTGTVLTRTTVYSSSNGGSTVNFATGTQYVWCDFPASKALTTFSAGTTGLTPNTATSGAITLAGTLATGNGGTGVATLTGIAYGNGTSAFTVASTAQVLSVIGTVPIANGGTNSTATPTAGGAGYGTGTAHAYTAAGTTGQVLTSAGTSVPTWSTPIALSGTNTWTGTQSFTGSTSVLASILTNAAEVCTVSATAATGTIAYYPSTQSVLYYTSNASANWTVNLAFSSGTTMNTALATGQSLTVTFLVTQGATAYYNSAVQVDGTTSGVTTKWQGGAPTAGNASGIDVYTYTIIKTASATFTVLASQTQFK